MNQIETSLTAVTVYPDRARLTRRGETTLEPGNHSLEISDLPIQLEPASVRVAARGTARALILGLQVERLFYAETPIEQVRELETQLEKLQDDMTALDTRIELVKTNRTRVNELLSHTQVFATALAAGEMKIEHQQVLFTGLTKQVGELDAQAQELAVQKRTLDRKINQVKNQLDQVRNARRSERYRAYVELEVLSAGSLVIELTYTIKTAGWKPLYDLRLVEEAEKSVLDIGYLAQISQQTGENWQAVDLTLSTARPALSATLPELDPWYIHPRPLDYRAAPSVAKQAMAKSERAMLLPQALAPGAEAEAVYEAEEMVARVETTGAAVTYHIPALATIPGDGAPHKVTVARYLLTPRMDYMAVPRLVEAVYRRARLVNDSPYTLLPGSSNLFAGDEFIGVTRLKLTAPQSEMELFLGVDDRIKVERELKRREVEKTIIGGKRRVHYGYEIRLENMRDVAVSLTLQDHMPVSRHTDIKVRLERAEPAPDKQDELNRLEWSLNLPPRQKLSLRFDFMIEYPQEMEISGLP